MTINRYRAKSLKAAIQKAKTDLGVDAKMIHLRQLENCEDKVEIIAVMDENVNAPETQDARHKTQGSLLVTRHSLLSNRRILNALHECCLKNEVDPDITYEILSLLNDDLDAESSQAVTATDYLSLFIKDQISVSGGLAMDKKTAIFIGPTGVGKSTTLAKLAAQYHFQQEKTVGIVTIDAYRIAAVEQLKTYAQIMSLPFRVALTPEELERVIKDYKNLDIILVDTPGRSQYNTEALASLEEFLEAAQPADTHLLIAVTMKEDDAYVAAENFAPQYVQQLIFTKLDETSRFGSILNIGVKVGKPISYLTTGQNVPDDIEVAQLERVVDLFLEAKYVRPGN
jgi:flagellar biosynthesis protein FlhF